MNETWARELGEAERWITERLLDDDVSDPQWRQRVVAPVVAPVVDPAR